MLSTFSHTWELLYHCLFLRRQAEDVGLPGSMCQDSLSALAVLLFPKVWSGAATHYSQVCSQLIWSLCQNFCQLLDWSPFQVPAASLPSTCLTWTSLSSPRTFPLPTPNTLLPNCASQACGQIAASGTYDHMLSAECSLPISYREFLYSDLQPWCVKIGFGLEHSLLSQQSLIFKSIPWLWTQIFKLWATTRSLFVLDSYHSLFF